MLDWTSFTLRQVPISMPTLALILAMAWTPSVSFSGDLLTFDPPKVGHIRQQTKRLMTEHAQAWKNDPDDLQSTLKLCNWYVVLRSDPRHVTSSTIESQAFLVRSRLLRVAKQIRRRLKREDFEYDADQLAAFQASIAGFLSDMRAGEIGGTGGLGGTGDASGKDDHANDDEASRDKAAFAVPGELEQAAQLVELIEKMVRPEFWMDAGGPGVIHYYAARRV
ncbi:MAG: hypothetical protein AAF958_06155, partial [Planctomycetota bacterium]